MELYKRSVQSRQGNGHRSPDTCKRVQREIGYEIINYKVVDLPISEYVHSSKYDPENLYRMTMLMLNGMEDTGLKSLTIRIYEKYHDKIVTWSAAKSMHHDYKGGLIEHVCRMILHAQMTTKIYPGLNEELLLCATALHDIGKLDELDTDELGASEYTVPGTLLGHPFIGAQIIEREFKELHPDTRSRVPLRYRAFREYGMGRDCKASNGRSICIMAYRYV